MIRYDRLWKLLKERGISQYQLINEYGINKNQLHRLRDNKIVRTLILDTLCHILDCRIEDIAEYVSDDNRKRLP